MIATPEFAQRYNVAVAYRVCGEADGDVLSLEMAAAEFFDIGMYAASQRCLERARYYRKLYTSEQDNILKIATVQEGEADEIRQQDG